MTSPSGGLFSVGPFTVLEALVRAPGAWLVKAQDSAGELFLLQLAHCRTTKSSDEEVKRQYFEHTVQKATAALIDEPQLEIKSHGGADRPDKSRVLFWAVPWWENAERLRNPHRYLMSLAHVLQIGISLTQRIARRHEQHRLEPLLCEQLLLIKEDNTGAELIGAPVHLKPEWLARDMLPARIAPEETQGPQKSGDLWRLGQTLDALSRSFEPLPPQIRGLIDGLSAPQIAQRIKMATDVIVELEMLRQALGRGQIAHTPGAATINVHKVMPEGKLSEQLLNSVGGLDDLHRLPTERVHSALAKKRNRAGPEDVTASDIQIDPEQIKTTPGHIEPSPTPLVSPVTSEELTVGPEDATPTPSDIASSPIFDVPRLSLSGPVYSATIVDDFDPLPAQLEPELREPEPEDVTLDTNPSHLGSPAIIAGVPEIPPPRPEQASSAERDTDLEIEAVSRRVSSVLITPVDPDTEPSSKVEMHPPPAPQVHDLLEADTPAEPRPALNNSSVQADQADLPEKIETLPDTPSLVAPVMLTHPTSATVNESEEATLDETLGLTKSNTEREAEIEDRIARLTSALSLGSSKGSDTAADAKATTPDVVIGAANEPAKSDAAQTIDIAPPASPSEAPTPEGSAEVRTAHQERPEPQREAPAEPALSLPTPSSVPSPVPSPIPSDTSATIAIPSVIPSSVPAPVPSAPPSIIPSTVPSATPSVPASDVPSIPLEPAIVEAAMPKRRAPAVMGVIILVVAVLVGFFGMRAFYKSEQSEAQKPSVMVTASKLVLKASPSDTMVISAIDGRNLGKTPLNLMVPTDTSPVVLLAAKGHQPQRLVLPDRGQLGISLFAQESEPEPCLIDVVAEGAVLEGFLSNIEKNKSLSIPGAAVVKARRGRAQGAWLLRCPPSGKPKRLQPQTPTEVRMKINAPEGAKLYVDGGSAGTIPTEITVESGFHEVRVEDGEDSAAWWVPALVNVEMSLDL